MYASIEELVSDATIKNLPISELVIQAECNDMNVSRNDVWRKMKHNLDTMRLAVSRGAHGIGVHSKTGLTGGDAVKIKDYRKSHKTLSGDMIMSAVQSAIATNEVNAAMGVVCATPTAGSSGTLHRSHTRRHPAYPRTTSAPRWNHFLSCCRCFPGYTADCNFRPNRR